MQPHNSVASKIRIGSSTVQQFFKLDDFFYKGRTKGNILVISEIIKRQVEKKHAQLSLRALDFVCTRGGGRLPVRFRRVISLISQYAAGSNSRSRYCRHFRVSPIISPFLRNLISNVRCAISERNTVVPQATRLVYRSQHV